MRFSAIALSSAGMSASVKPASLGASSGHSSAANEVDCAIVAPPRRSGQRAGSALARRSSLPFRGRSEQPLEILGPAHRHLEVAHKAIADRIDPAMDRELLPARPRLLHEDIRGDVAHLADDVELAQPVETLLGLGYGVELAAVIMRHFADGMKPVIDK